jgi:hypothetical protein
MYRLAPCEIRAIEASALPPGSRQWANHRRTSALLALCAARAALIVVTTITAGFILLPFFAERRLGARNFKTAELNEASLFTYLLHWRTTILRRAKGAENRGLKCLL